MTAAAGYALAGGIPALSVTRLLSLLGGTGLTCLGAAMLNQAMEWKWDGLMTRTRSRPLPSGKISRPAGYVLGTSASVLGLGVLWLGVPFLSFALAGCGWAIYLGIYTPLKRRTAACILPGAIAGALPPMIGTAACDGRIGWYGGFLFALLLVWQLPHLLAIVWLHKDDYVAAGFAIPSRGNLREDAIPAVSLCAVIILSIISALPYGAGTLKINYLAGAAAPNLLMLFFAARLLANPNRETARRLFKASIVYLPWMLGVLLLTRS